MVLCILAPYLPTVHLNHRYSEAWSSMVACGGADLNPYYPFAEDAFHSFAQNAFNDAHHPECHPVFAGAMSIYLKHRQETRELSGIFFDYQDGQGSLQVRGPHPSCAAAHSKLVDWNRAAGKNCLLSSCGRVRFTRLRADCRARMLDGVWRSPTFLPAVSSGAVIIR